MNYDKIETHKRFKASEVRFQHLAIYSPNFDEQD